MANYRDIAIMSVNHGINELGLSISDEENCAKCIILYHTYFECTVH